MATLNNCEVRWPILKDPSNNFDESKPRWSIEIVTRNKAQKAEWEAAGLSPKLKEDKETGEAYYSVRLSKNAYGSDPGAIKNPPQVVDGLMEPITDPNIIGNGSICNIAYYQSEYFSQKEKKMTKRNTLMGVQVLKLRKYTPKPKDDFKPVGATEIIEPVEAPDSNPFV